MSAIQPPQRFVPQRALSQGPASGPKATGKGKAVVPTGPTRAPAHGDQPVEAVAAPTRYGGLSAGQGPEQLWRVWLQNHAGATTEDGPSAAVSAYRRWTELDPKADPLVGLFLNRRA